MQIDPIQDGRTRILLADDHPVVREGIRIRLETEPDFNVVGEVGDGAQVVEAARKLRPDVVVLDYVMPNETGIQVAQKLSRGGGQPHIVMLSMHTDEAYVVRALNCGIRGYVAKSAATDELVSAIRTVMSGDRYLSHPHSEESIEEYLRSDGEPLQPFETLTPREREIADIIVKGLNSREIAERLDISERTVETHRSHIRKKLGAKTTAQMVGRYLDERDKSGEA